jgi:hypothetical protein
MLASNGPLQRTYVRQILVGLGVYTALYGASQWMQESAGYSASAVGLILLPLSAVSIVVARLASSKGWVRWPLVLGAVSLVACGAVMFMMHASSSVLVLVGMSVLFGLSNGLSSFANQTALYTQAPADTIATASGLYRTAGYVGAILSSIIALSFGARVSDGGFHLLAAVVLAIGVGSLLLDRPRPADPRRRRGPVGLGGPGRPRADAVRDRDAGLPGSTRPTAPTPVERGVDPVADGERDRPRGGLPGCLGAAMSANHGREASVSIRPGHSATMSLPSARSASRRSAAIARTAATWATLDGMFSHVPKPSCSARPAWTAARHSATNPSTASRLAVAAAKRGRTRSASLSCRRWPRRPGDRLAGARTRAASGWWQGCWSPPPRRPGRRVGLGARARRRVGSDVDLAELGGERGDGVRVADVQDAALHTGPLSGTAAAAGWRVRVPAGEQHGPPVACGRRARSRRARPWLALVTSAVRDPMRPTLRPRQSCVNDSSAQGHTPSAWLPTFRRPASGCWSRSPSPLAHRRGPRDRLHPVGGVAAGGEPGVGRRPTAVDAGATVSS